MFQVFIICISSQIFLFYIIILYNFIYNISFDIIIIFFISMNTHTHTHIYFVAPLNAYEKSQLMQPINIIDRSQKEFHRQSVIPLADGML